MRQPETSVDDIAERLGFSQSSSFARAFRSWTGKTPSEFRGRQ
ncbi:MAG: helix-turn-helix domain-containing protein [Hyphomicrobiales bacterium]|nr:helix-turn-helix domain-containing protein [Hyphomicrobiales bacterium]